MQKVDVTGHSCVTDIDYPTPAQMASVLGRIALQITWICGTTLARSLLHLYTTNNLQKQLSQGVKSVTRRMGVEEARKILEVPTNALSMSTIEKRFQRLYEINCSTDTFSGSAYLQKKVKAAKLILEQHLRDLKS